MRSRVQQVLKRYDRGEVEHVEWLDRLSLAAVGELRQREQAARQEAAELGEAALVRCAPCCEGLHLGMQAREAQATAAWQGIGRMPTILAPTRCPPTHPPSLCPLPPSSLPLRSQPGVAPGGLSLAVELPSFPRTVIYQQATAAAGHVAGGAAAPGGPAAGATADAISTPLPGMAGGAPGGGTPGGSLMLLVDAEVGRENPAEAKAAKLARSLTRGMVDKRLKPDTEERRRIEAVLDSPPNR